MPRRLSENGFHVGDWVVEPGLNRVTRDEDVVTLEPKTLSVLVYLAARAGEVVSAEEILTELWPDTMVNDGSIYWYIARLRKAFGDDPKNQQTIRTVPKKGYQLVAPVLDRPVTEMTNELGTVANLLAESTTEEKPGAEMLAERRPIAVLPFLSLGEEDDLFCEGLTIELQNVLAHVRGLRVAGRSSSFAFRERQLDLRLIGRLLGVGHVVEGTVGRGEEVGHGRGARTYHLVVPAPGGRDGQVVREALVGHDPLEGSVLDPS